MKIKRIINKLLIWFLLIALVPLTSVTIITFFLAKATQTKEVKNNLVAIAESKAKQLENYIQERENNANAIAKIPNIINAIEDYQKTVKTYGINSPEYRTADNKYRQFLSNYLEIFDYSNIYLISQSGDAIFSVKKFNELGVNYYSSNYRDSEIAKVFDRAKTLMQVEVSNFGTLDRTTSQPAAYIAAPVFNKNLIVGVVVVQLNYQNFNKVVNDYTGLGETGETIVGSVVGSQIIFISPTRHDPKAAFRRTIKVAKERIDPLDKASHGQKGIGITIDYQGKETVAAWRYLPSLNGGILVKINASEAFSSLKNLGKVVIILGFVTLCVVLIAAFVVAKSISKPVVKLTQIVQELARGNLNQQAPVLTHDEIGQLAESFNSMNKDLNALVNRIQQSGNQITHSTNQITASGRNLEATIADQVVSTNEVSATAHQIAATSRELVKTMEHLATMSEQTTVGAGNSRDHLNHIDTVMRQLLEATQVVSSKLEVMNERANNINRVVTTITVVADRTNLLSLNAALEAERAGKYGAGFAVVAREIRRLADQTTVAALEIERMIKEMQSAVAIGVVEMNKFNHSVVQSVTDVSNISDQIAQVIQQVQGLTPRFERVSQSVDEQSQGAQQISAAMEQLSQGSQQTADSLHATNQALRQLDEAAHGLKTEISRFKVME